MATDRHEKDIIRSRTKSAIRTGLLVRPDKCPVCSHDGPLEVHHTSYRHWSDAVFLCHGCHREAHGMTRYRAQAVGRGENPIMPATTSEPVKRLTISIPWRTWIKLCEINEATGRKGATAVLTDLIESAHAVRELARKEK